MLYNIDINQLAIIQNYPETKLKLNHFALLDAIYKLRDLDWTKRYFINGREYIWTSTKLLKSQLPLLDVSEKQIKRYILSLVEEGFLQRNDSFENPNKMLVCITDKTANMKVYINNNVDINVHKDKKDVDINVQGGGQKCTTNVDINVHHNLNELNHKEENHKEFKNKEMNKTNELVLQNQSLINNQFDGILDLSVRYNCKDIEIETQLNEILKSEKMNAVKKLYNEVARNNLFKGKTYDNILNWHKNNLKINCLTSIWLYDYEVIKLRMKYNADYLLKIIYEIDRYLQDPTKFSKYTDQYKFIENWIKRDIGHILTIKTHIRVDMYDYVNYGVDYDLFK